MSELWPDDVENFLRHLREGGDDLAAAREVEFSFVMPDEASARSMGEAAHKLGYATDIRRPWTDPEWQVNCVINMVPRCSAILDAERPLSGLAEERGGQFEAWGCEVLS